jgi:hypothetical protein
VVGLPTENGFQKPLVEPNTGSSLSLAGKDFREKNPLARQPWNSLKIWQVARAGARGIAKF